MVVWFVSLCSCPRLYNCCGEWEGWDPFNRFNHTSWVAIVTPTKSVYNSCVVEICGGFIVLSHCFLDFSVGVAVGAFCHRTEPDLFLFPIQHKQISFSLIYVSTHSYHFVMVSMTRLKRNWRWQQQVLEFNSCLVLKDIYSEKYLFCIITTKQKVF